MNITRLTESVGINRRMVGNRRVIQGKLDPLYG
jgi:hypothetical protein